ncbi:MAG: DUF4149 domain-containing protein [Acidobacteria bacterium]|nr:DUF4149 domain-containing protein [Acidobacteriota bacterium]
MPILRVASLAVMALWIGGLATLGMVAAPSLFYVLEHRDPEAGRALAGLLFGQIFLRFQQMAWFLGGALLTILGMRAALGPRPRRLAIQVWLVTAMLAISLYAGLMLAPRIETLRADTPATLAALPDTDPRKVEFGRLHGLSNGLMGLTLLAGLAVFWIEARE